MKVARSHRFCVQNYLPGPNIIIGKPCKLSNKTEEENILFNLFARIFTRQEIVRSMFQYQQAIRKSRNQDQLPHLVLSVACAETDTLKS